MEEESLKSGMSESKLKQLEYKALNDTLDDMILEISAKTRDGASSNNITEKIEITNLKDYVYKNPHGLYEIKLDTSRLLLVGS